MVQKTAYLTIDDAPSKDFKKKVDFLSEKNIPAILFCRGDSLEKRGDDAIYAIKRRFVIANHSYSHPRFSGLALEEALSQISRTDNMIEYLYSKAKVKRPAKLFRFPYGDKGGSNYRKIQRFLEELGYGQPSFENINYDWFNNSNLKTDLDVYWTFDVKEWCLKGDYDPKIRLLKDVLNRMQQKEHEEGGSLLNMSSAEIVVMHDHEETTDFFFEIIDKLLSMNIRFVLPRFRRVRP
jgi:peptidoglycan/xylan/chitin deacetylase (PgdA/CDA1 family)